MAFIFISILAGHGAMIGIVNSAVHTIMYFYYLLTCINSDYKKNIWWKKYITQLQIVSLIRKIIFIISI